MRVAVITDEKLPKVLHGFKIKVIPWDTDVLENENLRDYDGVIVDAESYSKLGKVSSPEIIEDDVITPMITYDILKSNPSFFIVLGDPSRAIRSRDVMGAMGFVGNHVKGSGTQHNLTKRGANSIYRNYLTDIKRYKYSYENAFNADADMRKFVQVGRYTQFITQSLPLMLTKSDYLTAFHLQGMSYHTDSFNRIVDSLELFGKSLPTFLPSHPEGLQRGVDMLLLSYGEREVAANESEPEWASQITVQGQAKIDSEIEAKLKQIQELTSAKDTLEAERMGLRKILEILYLAERPLESALKHTFQDYGFVVDDPEDNNNVEFYLRNEKQEFVVEVKSSTKPHFNKEGLRQVNEWRENEALDSGKEYKPVLILSNEYDKPLEARNADDIIDENLTAYAVSRKIAVITTPVLYKALQYVSEGKLTKDALAEVLFKAAGLLKLEDFYVEEIERPSEAVMAPAR